MVLKFIVSLVGCVLLSILSSQAQYLSQDESLAEFSKFLGSVDKSKDICVGTKHAIFNYEAILLPS